NPNPTGLTYEKASIELPPSVVPNEETVQLPKGVAIDLDRCGLWSSVLGYQPFNAMGPALSTYVPTKLPSTWLDGNGNYTQRMDLMFSPRGTITGPTAAQGVIQLYVTDTKNLAATPLSTPLNNNADSAGTVTFAQLFDPAYGVNAISADLPVVDKSLVTVFTRTGNVTCTPVNIVDAFNNTNGNSGADGFADDPFFYAERGEVAGR